MRRLFDLFHKFRGNDYGLLRYPEAIPAATAAIAEYTAETEENQMSSFNFQDLSISAMLAVHNQCAALTGANPRKGFKDRADAEKATSFQLSMVTDPAKRPVPFATEGSETGRASGGAKQQGAQPVKATQPTTKPEKKAAASTSADPRWRKPKTVAPAKVAYRPKAGTILAHLYDLLAVPEGAGVELDTVAAATKAWLRANTKPWAAEKVWSKLYRRFHQKKGYGLELDGQGRVRLLVPADERAPRADDED